MIFLASHEGQAILFRETEVRAMGRNAGGVNGMDLAKDDYVVSMDAVQPDFEISGRNRRRTRRISTSSKTRRSRIRSPR